MNAEIVAVVANMVELAFREGLLSGWQDGNSGLNMLKEDEDREWDSSAAKAAVLKVQSDA